MVTKFLTVFYYTWLSGGALMQIPPVMDLIEADKIDIFVYNGILIVTAILWTMKFVLNLYDRKKEIDEKYRRK